MTSSVGSIDQVAKPSLKSVYVFTPWLDFATFLLPLFVGLIFFAIYFSAGMPLHPKETPVWMAIPLAIGLNFPHTISTVFRTYLDPEQLRQRKKLLILMPITIFIFNVVLTKISMTFFLHCLAYLAFYHGMRQDYGWVRLAAAKAQENKLIDRYLNSAMVYSTHGIPLIWLLSRNNRGIWFAEGDFPKVFPEAVGEVALYFFGALSIAYFFRQIWLIQNTRVWSPAKNFVILSAGIAWYIIILVFEMRSVFQIVLPTLIHAVPYSIFLFRYRALKIKNSTGRDWRWFGVSGVVATYVILIVLGALHQKGLESVNQYVNSGSVLWVLLIGLFALPQNLHYVLDGFIWRPGKDLSLRQKLNKI